MELLVGQVLLGRFWNLTIYGEELQHWIFLDNRPFASERDPVFRLWSCPSPAVPMGRGETLARGAAVGQGWAQPQCCLCKMPQGLCSSLSCFKGAEPLLSWSMCFVCYFINFSFYISFIKDLLLKQ